MMPGFAVALEGVSRSFRLGAGQVVNAVDDVTLSVPAGAAVAITGPSGSGKSTLLHLVGAMDRPDGGRVVVDGSDRSRLRERDLAAYRRSIGFVFQRFHLVPTLTVLDNVIAPVLPYRTGFHKQDRGRELLDAVGLADRGGLVPGRLSGGEQQRVAIARALINQPGLVLADEPTGNLDSVTSAEIMQLLLDLRRRHAMTLLVATHDATIASRCDRIVKLRDGRVVDDLTLPATDRSDAVLQQIEGLAPGV
jgi:putative ABC transport system ATP-binding protein